MQADEYKALRKLAISMLVLAAQDFRKPGAGRETKRECADFLTRETVWHAILNLHPDRAARWLRSQVEGTTQQLR